jgi:hypothetical protein
MLVEQNDTNLNLVDGINAAGKKRKNPRKVTEPSGYSSQNLESVNPSTTNKPRETQLSKPDRYQPDPRAAYPGSSVKQLSGALPVPTASHSHVGQATRYPNYSSPPTVNNYTYQSPSTNKIKKHSFASNSPNMSSIISQPQNEPIIVTHGPISRGTNSRGSESINDRYNPQKSYF